MTAHPQADLLQQLADEAKVNPEPWRAFEYSPLKAIEWRSHSSLSDLIDSIDRDDFLVRRKPRTIRVSGEVLESALTAAQAVLDDMETPPDRETIARALLSLVEES